MVGVTEGDGDGSLVGRQRAPSSRSGSGGCCSRRGRARGRLAVRQGRSGDEGPPTDVTSGRRAVDHDGRPRRRADHDGSRHRAPTRPSRHPAPRRPSIPSRTTRSGIDRGADHHGGPVASSPDDTVASPDAADRRVRAVRRRDRDDRTRTTTHPSRRSWCRARATARDAGCWWRSRAPTDRSCGATARSRRASTRSSRRTWGRSRTPTDSTASKASTDPRRGRGRRHAGHGHLHRPTAPSGPVRSARPISSRATSCSAPRPAQSARPRWVRRRTRARPTASVSGTVGPNTGPIQPGMGEELNVEILNPLVVIDVVVVKGSNGYNLYLNPAVLPPTLLAPQHYISPLTDGTNVPKISHWFVCYHLAAPPAPGTLVVDKKVVPPNGDPVNPLPPAVPGHGQLWWSGDQPDVRGRRRRGAADHRPRPRHGVHGRRADGWVPRRLRGDVRATGREHHRRDHPGAATSASPCPSSTTSPGYPCRRRPSASSRSSSSPCRRASNSRASTRSTSSAATARTSWSPCQVPAGPGRRRPCRSPCVRSVACRRTRPALPPGWTVTYASTVAPRRLILAVFTVESAAEITVTVVNDATGAATTTTTSTVPVSTPSTTAAAATTAPATAASTSTTAAAAAGGGAGGGAAGAGSTLPTTGSGGSSLGFVAASILLFGIALLLLSWRDRDAVADANTLDG